MSKKISRKFFSLGTVIVIGVALTYAFWPRPMMVDMGEVTRGQMRLTINEEGRTQVHDAYALSTPVAGRLLRVDVHPGDAVERGETVVARMLPTHPTALDLRTREQARAEVTAAEAALRLARAELNKAVADRELADSELKRNRRLREDAMVSQSVLDRAVREAKAAEAQLGTAKATIEMREAELTNARTRLITYRDEEGHAGVTGAATQEEIPVYSPATGRVLRVMQESETTLTAGVPILEIGNIDNDLEVVVELLSSDAVKISPGDKVIFEDWGGTTPLNGVVARIDPWGFTKVSALGVEEQRVNTLIQFTDPPQAREKLGHGFRVEAQIVVWEDQDALIVPSSALFRDGREWAVFVVADGTATRRRIEIGRNNGVDAQVLSGLESGEKVIMYPSSELSDGVAVSRRVVE